MLADTHAFLWFMLTDRRLSDRARAEIADPSNRVFVSPASYWEIAIKIQLGKFSLREDFGPFWRDGIAQAGLTILPISIRHAEALLDLPLHHRDPFDRMLAAQCLADGLTIVSADRTFDRYELARIW